MLLLISNGAFRFWCWIFDDLIVLWPHSLWKICPYARFGLQFFFLSNWAILFAPRSLMSKPNINIHLPQHITSTFCVWQVCFSYLPGLPKDQFFLSFSTVYKMIPWDCPHISYSASLRSLETFIRHRSSFRKSLICCFWMFLFGLKRQRWPWWPDSPTQLPTALWHGPIQYPGESDKGCNWTDRMQSSIRMMKYEWILNSIDMSWIELEALHGDLSVHENKVNSSAFHKCLVVRCYLQITVYI